MGLGLAGKSKLSELILRFMAKRGIFDSVNVGDVTSFPMDKKWPENLVNKEAIIIQDLKSSYFD